MLDWLNRKGSILHEKYSIKVGYKAASNNGILMQRRKERIDFYIRTNDTVDKEIPSDNIDYLSRIQRMLGAIYVGVSHVFYVNRFHSISGASRSDQMFEDISIISNHFLTFVWALNRVNNCKFAYCKKILCRCYTFWVILCRMLSICGARSSLFSEWIC